MTQHATLAYAHHSLDATSDRLLRLGVAWFAIVTGGCAIAGMTLHVALARGWAAMPKMTSWSIGNDWHVAFAIVDTLVMAAMLIGGLLLLRRSQASFMVLRAATVGWFVVTLANHGITLLLTPSMASHYSTPATMAVYATNALSGLLPIALFGLLTLPPMSTRMLPRA